MLYVDLCINAQSVYSAPDAGPLSPMGFVWWRARTLATPVTKVDLSACRPATHVIRPEENLEEDDLIGLGPTSEIYEARCQGS